MSVFVGSWLSSQTSGLEHNEPASLLDIKFNNGSGSGINLKEGHRLIRLQRSRIGGSLLLPLIILILVHLPERFGKLKGFHSIEQENQSRTYGVGTRSRVRLRPNGDLLDDHLLIVGMFHKHSRSWVVGGIRVVVIEQQI